MFKKFSKNTLRLFSMLLSLSMIFSTVSFAVPTVAATAKTADETVNEAVDDGIALLASETDEDYIEISTIQDLYNVRLDLTANYILMNDIDLTEATASGGEWDFDGRGWNPIGSNNIYSNEAFSGIFDGNGHSIIGMRIAYTSDNKPSGIGSSAYAGLFANVTGEVRNLDMKNVNIEKAYAYDKLYVGAIAAYNSGVIKDCSVSGNVKASAGGYYVGAISGYNKGTISGCYNTATVIAHEYAGGISGYNTKTIENCYNTGAVSETYGEYAGGITGYNSGTSEKVDACYNIGAVSAQSKSKAYAIAFTPDGTTTNSYYLSGTGVGSTGATALTAAQTKVETMYVGFDFDNIWLLNTNAIYTYPQLISNPQDNRDVKSAEISSLADKLVYLKEEELDMTGCVLEFTYTNADMETVYVTEDMVSGYDSEVVGEQTLTITYNFRTFEFNVTVEEKQFKEVYTILDLYNIRYDLNSNYILMNDIDLTEATASGGEWDFDGRGWNPIGSNDIYSNEAFSGIFDGNGHSIIGMRIEYTSGPSGMGSTGYAGLFAKVTGEIRDLEMKNVNISKAYASGDLYVGAITAYNSGVIKNCSVSGKVSAASDGTYVGGLVGYNNSTGTIIKSFNTASVVGYKDVGGISGYNYGIITDCYNTGNITYKNHNAGGITSYNAGSSAKIINCYNIGTISGTYQSQAYAIAYNATGTTTDSYYLTGTGVGSVGATALSSAQLYLKSSYSGFDLDNIWYLDAEANFPYPQLKDNSQDIRVVSESKIYTLPTKLIYIKGELFNPDGLVLEFKFENADTEYVYVTNDMVSGFDSSKLGIQTLSVTYYRKTLTFDVTVNEKPFIQISTVKDLYDVRLDLTANYILMNDIDLTEATASGGEWDFDGRGWNPIGSNDIYDDLAFSGIFDGNGYSIIGMRINASSLPSGASTTYSYAGLFANVTGEVRNLDMKAVNITNGCEYTGAIAAVNGGTIINCSVSGTVNSDNTAGGLVADNDGIISKCYNTAEVKGLCHVGGIAGKNSKIISDCYNTAEVNNTYNYKGNYAGGITAYNYGSSTTAKGQILRCYNTGKVTAKYSNSDAYAIACNSSSSYSVVTDSYYLSGSGVGSTGATALTDTQLRLQEMFTGFDFDKVWTINANANHPYPQLQSNIQDLNETVTLIRVIAYPAKMEYLTGDELDLVGGMFEAVYISGKTDLLSISPSMITGYDPNTVGTQTLTVNYGGQTDTFDITVSKRPEATAVTLLTEPTQKEFVVGTSFDFSGATVKVEYDDGTNEVLDVTLDMTTGANINHMGTQTVTVTFGDYSDTFEIKVVPASISSITVSEMPKKLVYIEGEKLDTTGLTIVANYSNGSEISIASGYTITGYDANKIGEQTITVTFVGKSTTFKVEVVEKVLTSIEVQAKPDKLDYTVGEELDLTGMVVVASYETGELEIVEDYTVSGYDGKAGIKVITVQYGGKSASFTVNVAVVAVEKLTITKLPVKLAYIENEPMNTEGLVVVATYNNGNEVTLDEGEYEIIGFSSLPGVHTLYVSFGGQVASFQINVAAKVLSDVRVTAPAKTAYLLGEEFDDTGLVVTAFYNNGQEITLDKEDYQISGFDSAAPGTKSIKVSYNGIERSFAVVVYERTSIETGGHMTVGTAIGRLGEEVSIPVIVTKNTGIAGFKHDISFDADNLAFVTVEMVGDFADGSLVVNEENADEGKLNLVWYDSKDVSGDGTVYNIVFEILETATDGDTEITIDFEENGNANVSGENVTFTPTNGSVEIRSYWLGDLNGDRQFRVADLLHLAQYVAGIEKTLTDKQKLSADVNEDTIIDIHDVVMLQQWIVNAGVPNAQTFAMLAAVNDMVEDATKISLGEIKGKVGQEVVVPVTIENNVGISAFMFEVAYNTEDLTFVSAELGGVLDKGVLITQVDEENQRLIVLWYSTEGDVSADGEMLPLTFKINDTASGTYDLSVRYLAEDILNEARDEIICSIESGKILVGSVLTGNLTSLLVDGNNDVTLVLSNGTEVIDELSISKGDYEFDSVAPGEYTLTVEKKNHATRTYTITVGDEDVALDVKLNLLGDIDGNGSVNMMDYLKAKQHSQGKNLLEDYAFDCADVSGDGKVNMMDYIKLKQHAQGTSSIWE